MINDCRQRLCTYRFSFATDITRAMCDIHAKGLCHGNLTSNNCLVDDRWTVKVTGMWRGTLSLDSNVISAYETKSQFFLVSLLPTSSISIHYKHLLLNGKCHSETFHKFDYSNISDGQSSNHQSFTQQRIFDCHLDAKELLDISRFWNSLSAHRWSKERRHFGVQTEGPSAILATGSDVWCSQSADPSLGFVRFWCHSDGDCHPGHSIWGISPLFCI